MLTEEIKSVLSFAAFRPDVDDADIPWAKRFEGRKSLLINIGRSQTSWWMEGCKRMSLRMLHPSALMSGEA
jgi:hypothetical protein